MDLSQIAALFSSIMQPYYHYRNATEHLDAYERSREERDLVAAVESFRLTVREVPDGHELNGMAFADGAGALTQLAELRRDIGLANEAVDYGAQAVAFYDDSIGSSQPSQLFTARLNLGTALMNRFWMTRCAAEDIDSSISFFNQCHGMTTGIKLVDRCGALSNLAVARVRKIYTQGSTFSDIDDALESIDQASELALNNEDPSARSFISTILSHKAMVLLLRYQRSQVGNGEDIDNAIAAARGAKRLLKDTDQDYPYNQHNLGLGLILHGERNRSIDDIDLGIKALEESIRTTPLTHLDLGCRLDSLGLAHKLRYIFTGDSESLEEAIKQRIATLCQDDQTGQSPLMKALFLSNLAASYHLRFQRDGSTEALNYAISAAKDAEDIAPRDSLVFPRSVNAHAALLLARYQHQGKTCDNDVNRAISKLKGIIERDGGLRLEFDRLAIYNNLAIALQHRGFENDNLEALGLLQDIINLNSHVSLYLLGILLTQVKLLLSLHKKGLEVNQVEESTGHLDRAIECGQRALMTIDPADTRKAETCSTIAKCLFARQLAKDWDDAILILIEGAESLSSPPSHRIDCAFLAGTEILASKKDNAVNEAYRMFKRAVELMPFTSPRSIHRKDQMRNLSRYHGLPTIAAALRLDIGGDGAALEALQLLELGRGILASLHMDTRSDMGDLERDCPDLALKLRSLNAQLDSVSFFDLTQEDQQYQQQNWTSTERRHQAVREHERVLAEIRSLPQFQGFMRAMDESTILSLASRGPIAIINVADHRGDALILSNESGKPGNKIRAIALPGLTSQTVQEKTQLLKKKLARSASDPAGYAETNKYLRNRLLPWLWQLVVQPILQELGYLDDTENDREENRIPRRIWWVPGGQLCLLPLHAAALANERGSGVISSYTPTLRALKYAREKQTGFLDERQERKRAALLVKMPTTPEQPDLNWVCKEIDCIKGQMDKKGIEITIRDGMSSSTQVLEELETKTYTYLHLACHGKSLGDPSLSHFLLHDWKTTPRPLNVNEITKLHASVQLAYLSACHTVDNPRTDLHDESIHLAAAVLLAGVPGVVGTLWMAQDRGSVQVAQKFYERVMDDLENAAVGLHDGVSELRAATRKECLVEPKVDDPLAWAPYVYFGV